MCPCTRNWCKGLNTSETGLALTDTGWTGGVRTSGIRLFRQQIGISPTEEQPVSFLRREKCTKLYLGTFKGRVWVFRAQELCGSRGGRPNKSYGFCGCKATLNRAGWGFFVGVFGGCCCCCCCFLGGCGGWLTGL